MSLANSHKRAQNFIRRLSPDEKRRMEWICRRIYESEKTLFSCARKALGHCAEHCRGLCCKNVDLDGIMGMSDFAYILFMAPEMTGETGRLAKTVPGLFSADCPFLKNGTGPCILPDFVRPEVCATTFCAHARSVGREIRQVKSAFSRLNRFVFLFQAKRMLRLILPKHGA